MTGLVQLPLLLTAKIFTFMGVELGLLLEVNNIRKRCIFQQGIPQFLQFP